MASKEKVFYEDLEIDRRKEDTLNNSVEGSKTDLSPLVPPLAKPLRILQFIILLALFSFIVYIISSNTHKDKITSDTQKEQITRKMVIFSILYLVLTTVFVFVIALDIISQFESSDLTNTPMVEFSFVGFLLFAITSIIMIFYMIEVDRRWVVMMLFILCVITTILFLIDLILYFSFWREKYMRNKKCYPHFAEEHQHLDTDILYHSKNVNTKEPKECKCDLSTSISNVTQTVMCENPNNEHIYRKIGIGQRREYVDRSDNTPSAMNDTIQVQTEPRKILVAECQTHRRESKEVPVQTLHQTEQNNFRIEPPSCIHPATPCFTVCRCGEETMLHEQQQQHLQLQLLQSSNETPIGCVTNENRGSDQATCPCPTFEIDFSSQSVNLPNSGTLTHTSGNIRNSQKIQTSLNEMSEKEIDTNGKDKVDNEKKEFDSSGERNSISEVEDSPGKTADYETKKIPSVETKSVSDEVLEPSEKKESLSDENFALNQKIIPKVEKKNIPDEVLESLDEKELLSDENFALSQKIIQMCQEAINRAEKTLSAPGSYNKPHKILEFPQKTWPILGSSAPKCGFFNKRNRVEPLAFQNCNKSPLPFVRKTILKLRPPPENCTNETRIIRTNQQEDDCKTEKESSDLASTHQNENEFPESEETCTCIARSKRTHKLCTVQVQYIFQDLKGRIICKSCSTPESIRIPQRITCSAQKYLTCYQCSKVLSPPCECSACSKKHDSV